MLYTMQSHNLLILFSALNISFKTSALLLHFHPHYIPLRQWPYAFDNGLLPSDVPRFVLFRRIQKAYSQDLITQWNTRCSRKTDLPTPRGHEGVLLMLPLAGITAAKISHVIPQDTKVSKCTNKRHILCLQSHPHSHTFTNPTAFSV